jgi:trehalose synthase
MAGAANAASLVAMPRPARPEALLAMSDPHRAVGIREVVVGERPFEVLAEELSPFAWQQLRAARERGRALLDGRTVWNINSSASGGGVAETLRATLPYWRGSGVDVRWLVITAGRAFFALTKRIHNLLHGLDSGRRLSLRDRAFYERVAQALAGLIVPVIRGGDVVMLHDPQTAGLASALRRAGAVVIWRCHVGADELSEPVEHAWQFLLPYVSKSNAQVFTREAFVPPGLDRRRVRVFAPAIDPCSPKNQVIAPDVTDAILRRCGLVLAEPSSATTPVAERAYGGQLTAHRRCTVMREGAPPKLGQQRLVVAVLRWDRIKDPIGIMRAFAQHVEAAATRLVVAGPAGSVADDPQGSSVLRAARATWRAMPAGQRSRIDLALLPMVDLDENALIVNALQRRAAVVLKKSLQEGFGLGVTEALWKARPVVATRVGGHQDQIQHRHNGLLVDPADLATFGAAVSELLSQPEQGLRYGLEGREVVRERFLADRHFENWIAAVSAADQLASAR